MKKRHLQIILGLIIIVFAFMYASINVVGVGEEGILLRSGKVVMVDDKPVVLANGLYWVWPLNESVQIFDMRLQSLSTDNMDFTSLDDKVITLSLSLQWQITDPVKFYASNKNNTDQLMALLQQTVQTDLSGKSLLAWLINPSFSLNDLQDLNQASAAYGISVKAAGINTMRLSNETEKTIYTSMQSHLNTLYAKLNAEALANVELIHTNAEANANVILASANSQASKIRAEGLANATEIYNVAYQASPEFYLFYRSMRAYEAVFSDPHTVLVLRPAGDFFKYFNSFASKP